MNTEQHILRAFDRDLETIQGLIMKMGGLAETAILDSARALETRDEDLARLVRSNDTVIDELDERINDEAARLIALRAPTAGDLRTVLTCIRIAASLERVGDYAKNIAKRANVLTTLPQITGATGAVRRMARTVEGMTKDALDAFIQRDLDLARDVRQRDQDVDQMYNALFREFLTYMMEDPRHITPCMHLHFIAKNIERMGDHATTIAEQVIYLVSGERPGEDRPKGESVQHVTPGEGA